MMNKRNALLGWAVWKIGKRVLKRKARAAVPAAVGGDAAARGKGLTVIVPLLAAIGGALWFWRRSADGGDTEPVTHDEP